MEIIYSYRYRIYKDPYTYRDKSDPYAYSFERRPSNASVMYDLSYFTFSDEEYLSKRHFSYDNPLNIYEDDYDYQLDSLNDTEIKLINEFLNNGNQAVLEKEFKQMYPDMNSYWTPVVREII